MAFNWRKLFYPTASDLFAPHTHIKALADSIVTFVPVANTTERAAVVAAAGVISAANPVAVIRADAAAGRKLEITLDGTNWTVLSYGAWTAYTPTLYGLAFGAGGSSSFQWRYEGDLVRVKFGWLLGNAADQNNPGFSLPVASVGPTLPFQVYGLASANPGYLPRPVFITSQSTSSTIVEVHWQNLVNGALDNLTLTSPGTFAVGQGVAGEFTFRPA